MMHFTPNLSLQQKLIKSSIVLLVATVVIGLLAFAGWFFSVELLKHPLPGLGAMNPLTSLCFIAITYALFVKISYRNKRVLRIVADALIATVLVVCIWKLWSVFAGAQFVLDKYLFAKDVAGDIVAGLTNSMAPNTALCFILCAAVKLTCEFQFKFLLVFMKSCDVQQNFTPKFILFNSAVFPGFYINSQLV